MDQQQHMDPQLDPRVPQLDPQDPLVQLLRLWQRLAFRDNFPQRQFQGFNQDLPHPQVPLDPQEPPQVPQDLQV